MPHLHYWVSNGGDGSANVVFEEDAETAERKCDEQDEGWGENSSGSVELKVEDGKIFYKSREWNDETGDLTEEWIEVE